MIVCFDVIVIAAFVCGKMADCTEEICSRVFTIDVDAVNVEAVSKYFYVVCVGSNIGVGDGVCAVVVAVGAASAVVLVSDAVKFLVDSISFSVGIVFGRVLIIADTCSICAEFACAIFADADAV